MGLFLGEPPFNLLQVLLADSGALGGEVMPDCLSVREDPGLASILRCQRLMVHGHHCHTLAVPVV